VVEQERVGGRITMEEVCTQVVMTANGQFWCCGIACPTQDVVVLKDAAAERILLSVNRSLAKFMTVLIALHCLRDGRR